jgi:hypothetical protein
VHDARATPELVRHVLRVPRVREHVHLPEGRAARLDRRVDPRGGLLPLLFRHRRLFVDDVVKKREVEAGAGDGRVDAVAVHRVRRGVGAGALESQGVGVPRAARLELGENLENDAVLFNEPHDLAQAVERLTVELLAADADA